MKYMRHTQDTIGDLSKLIDDQHLGMELLGDVLATLKINLMRGAFDAIPHLDNWKAIITGFEQRHTKIKDKIQTNPVVNRYAGATPENAAIPSTEDINFPPPTITKGFECYGKSTNQTSTPSGHNIHRDL
jgi:hypothetical protein